MKKNYHSCALIFLIFLTMVSLGSARSLVTKRGEEEAKFNNITSGDSHLVQMEGSNDFNNLMGMEDCESGDEECLKRRVVAEAHLDYIYTQDHKP